MRITLQIENVDRLETGGQVSYSCADRGFDIGRHEHLDWSLPDPHRVVSGKHCEVRFEGGQFVLYDISTNGTFLNGSLNRMDKAHVLRSGDRLMIGDYIISVTLDAHESVGGGMGNPSSDAISSQGAAPWDAPRSAPPGASEPSWPAPQPSQQHSPYPINEPAGPWASPSSGMEGRHAPPSSAPGIGTPADDVWSQQGHGWGSADPALYDPNAQYPDREAARPAHADPLDHLAMQPDLQRPESPASPAYEGSDHGTASPFPNLTGAPGHEPPLFGLPDLGPSGAEAPIAEPPPAEAGHPIQQADSPFPVSPASVEPAEAAPRPDPAPSAGMPPAAAPPAAAVEAPEQPAVQSDAAAHAPVASTDFIKAFAEGAGIPQSVLAGRDPEGFARELGTILHGITGDLMGLLQARSQVKAMTRNANRTLISRSGNNALKFSPTPQMALQTMLSQGAEDNGYLPVDKAMRNAFKDIQKHHVWTYAAMQKAAARFDDTLSPKAIEREGQAAKSTFGNQKAKYWERIHERWTSLSGAYDDGIVGVFTQYFTESYEELTSEDPEMNSGSSNSGRID